MDSTSSLQKVQIDAFGCTVQASISRAGYKHGADYSDLKTTGNENSRTISLI